MFLPVQVDVGNPEDISQLYKIVLGRFSRVDILVNNSGATWGAPSFEYPFKGLGKGDKCQFNRFVVDGPGSGTDHGTAEIRQNH